MKKIIGILLIVLLVCVSTGCVEIEKEQKKETSMFTEVESANLWKVVYHNDTKVMYAVSWASYNSGNFTLLVDAEGKPLLWEGESQ